MSLKKIIFYDSLNDIFSILCFFAQSSLINEFILLNQRSYNKKGTDDIFSVKENNFW